MGIVDDMSGNVAHVTVPAGKLWFLGKSSSNRLCMDGWEMWSGLDKRRLSGASGKWEVARGG